MGEDQTYYDGLVAQGHAPDQALQYTQQHYPGFQPSAAAAPAPAPAPAPDPAFAAAPAPMAPAPMAAAPMAAAPMAVAPAVAVQPVAMVQPSGPTVIQTGGAGQTSTLVAYLLWFFLGWIGIHHLYIGRGIGIWLLSLITFQGLGFWWLADLFLIPSSVSKRNMSGQQIVVV